MTVFAGPPERELSVKEKEAQENLKIVDANFKLFTYFSTLEDPPRVTSKTMPNILTNPGGMFYPPDWIPLGFKPKSKTLWNHFAWIEARTLEQLPKDRAFNIIRDKEFQIQVIPGRKVLFSVINRPEMQKQMRKEMSEVKKAAKDLVMAVGSLPKANFDAPVVIRTKFGKTKVLPTFKIFINEHVGKTLTLQEIFKGLKSRGVDCQSTKGKTLVKTYFRKFKKFLKINHPKGKDEGIGSISILSRIP